MQETHHVVYVFVASTLRHSLPSLWSPPRPTSHHVTWKITQWTTMCDPQRFNLIVFVQYKCIFSVGNVGRWSAEWRSYICGSSCRWWGRKVGGSVRCWRDMYSFRAKWIEKSTKKKCHERPHKLHDDTKVVKNWWQQTAYDLRFLTLLLGSRNVFGATHLLCVTSICIHKIVCSIEKRSCWTSILNVVSC